jgi:quinol monooxygenase YgiN
MAWHGMRIQALQKHVNTQYTFQIHSYMDNLVQKPYNIKKIKIKEQIKS